MLKAGNLASQEDHRVRGVKSGRTRADRGISHVCFIVVKIYVQETVLPYSQQHGFFRENTQIIFSIKQLFYNFLEYSLYQQFVEHIDKDYMLKR